MMTNPYVPDSREDAIPIDGSPGENGASPDGAGGVGGIRDEASSLAHDAGDAGRKVAHTAKDETKQVASETGRQAKNLLSEAGSELKDQAAAQQSKAAAGIRSIGDELSAMANSSSDGGVASSMVAQAAGRVDSVASWLDARDPGSLLNEVKQFARRRPGVFIAIAVGAGIAAGRLTRALTAPAESKMRSSGGQDFRSTDLDPGPVESGYIAADAGVVGGYEPVAPVPTADTTRGL
jgi:hypothetical protein